MSFLIGVLIFVVALLVSVMLHEAGHFVTAKAFGMKATQFFVGFGSTIWSTRRGETEYGVKALPVGGFVKITGMTTIDDVDPADEPRSFRAKPGWQRAIVLASGLVHALHDRVRAAVDPGRRRRRGRPVGADRQRAAVRAGQGDGPVRAG